MPISVFSFSVSKKILKDKIKGTDRLCQVVKLSMHLGFRIYLMRHKKRFHDV